MSKAGFRLEVRLQSNGTVRGGGDREGGGEVVGGGECFLNQDHSPSLVASLTYNSETVSHDQQAQKYVSIQIFFHLFSIHNNFFYYLLQWFAVL